MRRIFRIVKSGEDIHHIRLALTIDQEMNVVDATAMQSRFALARMTHDMRGELEGDGLLPRPFFVDTVIRIGWMTRP